jgi:hypothetical protein
MRNELTQKLTRQTMSLRGLGIELHGTFGGGNALLSGLLDYFAVLVIAGSFAEPGIEESEAEIGVESIRSRGLVPNASNQRLKSLDVALIAGLPRLADYWVQRLTGYPE